VSQAGYMPGLERGEGKDNWSKAQENTENGAHYAKHQMQTKIGKPSSLPKVKSSEWKGTIFCLEQLSNAREGEKLKKET